MDLHIQKKSNSILNIELFCLARRFYSSVDTPVSDWFINNGLIWVKYIITQLHMRRTVRPSLWGRVSEKIAYNFDNQTEKFTVGKNRFGWKILKLFSVRMVFAIDEMLSFNTNVWPSPSENWMIITYCSFYYQKLRFVCYLRFVVHSSDSDSCSD